MKNGIKIYSIILGILLIAIFAYINLQKIADKSENKDVNNEIESEQIKEESKEAPIDKFIQCLVDKGVVVYASETCSACKSFAEMFGGYEKVTNLFVFCGKEIERCMNEMNTNYVPEIQINGEAYQGLRSLEGLAEATNCNL